MEDIEKGIDLERDDGSNMGRPGRFWNSAEWSFCQDREQA